MREIEPRLSVQPAQSNLKLYGFLFTLLLIFVALLLRNCGLHARILADEYLYSRFSRILPFAESTLPNFLYFAIYRLTKFSGTEFLESARVLNALFFVSAAPFIYFTARRACTKPVAFVIMCLALLGPINSYTAHFMPESLYFFFFWVLTWFALRLDASSGASRWAYTGVILGLASLVKPHALLILPALAAYSFFLSQGSQRQWAARASLNATVLACSTLAAKLLFGYVLAGKAGITLLGQMYSSLVGNHAPRLEQHQNLFGLFLQSLNGHLVGVSLMFGLSFLLAARTVLSRRSSTANSEVTSERKIAFYTLAIIGSLILTTAIFSAKVVVPGGLDTIERLHMRYYDFAFPLLLMVAGSQLHSVSAPRNLIWRTLAAIPVAGAIAYGIWTRLTPYLPNFADSPELTGFIAQHGVFVFLGCLSFLSVALWVYSVPLAARMFLFIFMPASVLISSFYINEEIRRGLEPDASVRAGLFARQYLGKEDLSRVVVVSSSPVGSYRALFYIDNKDALVSAIPENAPFDPSMMPKGKEIALIIGDHSIPDHLYTLPRHGFTLVSAASPNSIDFRRSSWLGVISKVQGLDLPEQFGAWSISDTVTLEFCNPLPAKFSLHLVANAFGPNIGKDIVITAGGNPGTCKLTSKIEDKVVELENPAGSSLLKIQIPSPTSPQELRVGNDSRTLGIGLAELRIVPRGAEESSEK